jgi:lycopene elongase/hydratase (dihydrobisanhydrobacterioruberin-forming)
MIRKLLAISRPRFWLYLGGTYLVGFTAGAGGAASFLGAGFWLHLLYFLVPANVFLYGINDLFDEDTDRHNPKKGSREHRLLSPEKRAVAAAVGVSIALGILLLLALPSWSARAFMLAFLLLGAGYSVPPVRFKARPFLDFPSNVLYAMPGFLGYVLASGHLPPFVAVAGAACWTGAMHLFSAVPDIAADRSAGLATSATVLGARPSLVLCALLWSVAAWSAWTLIGHPIAIAGAIYPLASLALVLRPQHVERAYWFFPWVNAGAGFLLFVLAAVG